MKDTTVTTCDRSDDLIAFLYHELGEQDARRFQQHVEECDSCENEISSFGEIRQSIVSWRDASLGAAWSSAAVTDRQAVFAAPVAEARIRPSALAAVREFFSLSPIWMKGAAAFASLLFCVCAVMAIAYLKNRTSVTVQSLSDKTYSRRELDTEVAKAVQMKEDEIRNKQAKEKMNEVTLSSHPAKATKLSVHMEQASYAGLRKPWTRKERRELAADLGLLVSRDEDDLDLVTDKIIQTP
ncbi:MAG: zf-HC2 domain-containing protein [Acidobacteriota bacterium]|nr:zf-HC2 domain-containing protein [Acidobacteriota bacterium]